jgi:hypothetical protein
MDGMFPAPKADAGEGNTIRRMQTTKSTVPRDENGEAMILVVRNRSLCLKNYLIYSNPISSNFGYFESSRKQIRQH